MAITGPTRNRLSPCRGTVGSNPTLSAKSSAVRVQESGTRGQTKKAKIEKPALEAVRRDKGRRQKTEVRSQNRKGRNQKAKKAKRQKGQGQKTEVRSQNRKAKNQKAKKAKRQKG